jgi:hypothetical protein
MGSLYLGQDRGIRTRLAVSSSGYVCECMIWLYVGQDRGMRLWADCILVRNSGVRD